MLASVTQITEQSFSGRARQAKWLRALHAQLEAKQQRSKRGRRSRRGFERLKLCQQRLPGLVRVHGVLQVLDDERADRSAACLGDAAQLAVKRVGDAADMKGCYEVAS